MEKDMDIYIHVHMYTCVFVYTYVKGKIQSLRNGISEKRQLSQLSKKREGFLETLP